MEKIPQTEEQLNQPIQLTKEEYLRLADTFEPEMDSPEFLVFLKEKGIEYDSGDIDIEVDGKRQKITTRKDDFGTRIE